MPAATPPLLLSGLHSDEHHEHRFAPVVYGDMQWDLSHLDPFAIHCDPGLGFGVDVVILFSCHCFTHDLQKDRRLDIPLAEIYTTSTERRVLNPERYELSRTILRPLVQQLPQRKIIVASPGQNYATYERRNADGTVSHYGVFFEAAKDKKRDRRIILRIQSAYIKELTNRHKDAKKVHFDTLLKAAYQGRKIRA